MDRAKPPAPAASTGIDAFLERSRNLPARQSGRGRLIFALDATMSRQPTWDLAQGLQAKMFEAAAVHGGLDVQLLYYRGLTECRASPFVSQGRGLAELMSRIDCRSGNTQIEKILRHVRDETSAGKVGAFVFIGDAMEEKASKLYALAGEIGLRGTKAFMFQEGAAPIPAQAFREVARLTGGAYAAFDMGAPARLAALLAAAAAYAAGGHAALEKRALEGESAARLLLSQMR
jgi:hypothetical protein